MQVFRIDEKSKIILTTAGEDIWVNMNGKKERQIIDDVVVLTDFAGSISRIPIEWTRRMPPW